MLFAWGTWPVVGVMRCGRLGMQELLKRPKALETVSERVMLVLVALRLRVRCVKEVPLQRAGGKELRETSVLASWLSVVRAPAVQWDVKGSIQVEIPGPW